MPGTFDPEVYRTRAKKWQKEADALPAGKERDGCLELADGYTKLAELLEKRASDLRPDDEGD